MSTKTNLFALILDNKPDEFGYLSILATRVGFRYILASHLDVFQDLLNRDVPASMILLRFESSLTVQLKAYLDIIAKPLYEETPILLLASEQTEEQAIKICERSNDAVIRTPCAPEELINKTALLMRRAVRQEMALRIWIEMDRRVVQGYSTNLSSGGVNVVIPDPVLGNKVNIRIFADKEGENGVLFSAEIRRKEKQTNGYALGLKLIDHLEGDLQAVEQAIGFRFDNRKLSGKQ